MQLFTVLNDPLCNALILSYLIIVSKTVLSENNFTCSKCIMYGWGQKANRKLV